MGIAIDVLRGQPHILEQLDDALAPPLPALELMDGERLTDDVSHCYARVERAVGVLEDDLHFAGELAQSSSTEGANVRALEVNCPTGCLDEPEDRAADGCLARPRLSDETHHLAGLDVERDRLHGLHAGDDAGPDSAPDRKLDAQVLHSE